MGTKTTFDKQEYLQTLHARYAHYNQQEPQWSRWMAEHGHPYARQYCRLRLLFDGLRYACNSRTRFVAFRNRENYVSYSAPELTVHNPHQTDWQCEFRGYPVDRNYPEFLQAVANHHWPAECLPRLHCGSFDITTQNKQFIVAAGKLLGVVPQACEARTWRLDYWGVSPGSMSRTLKLWRLVRHYTAADWLPARTPDDDEVDEAPLPLAYKHFVVSQGDDVVVTDHCVIVPRIKLGPAGQDQVNRAIQRLISLCHDGYPWQGAVRDWMKLWFPHPQKKQRDQDKDSPQIREWDKLFAHQERNFFPEDE